MRPFPLRPNPSLCRAVPPPQHMRYHGTFRRMRPFPLRPNPSLCRAVPPPQHMRYESALSTSDWRPPPSSPLTLAAARLRRRCWAGGALAPRVVPEWLAGLQLRPFDCGYDDATGYSRGARWDVVQAMVALPPESVVGVSVGVPTYTMYLCIFIFMAVLPAVPSPPPPPPLPPSLPPSRYIRPAARVIRSVPVVIRPAPAAIDGILIGVLQRTKTLSEEEEDDKTIGEGKGQD
eukprot:1181002-Prorocentrum_minimum.AAC.2